jgi:hypothetical protein
VTPKGVGLQETFELPSADLNLIIEHYMEQGWTDGLPIAPPTPDAVRRMLDHTDRRPEDVVGMLFPNNAPATVHAVAVNAVMAGCRPEYFPVVLAAVEAIADPAFNLYGVQATTNPAAPLIVVNGPIGRELGFNSKGNCFGPGVRANATVGRAVRLCMLNIAGGIPQLRDKATMGQPGKYGMCIAENEEDSPWEPFHVERGYPADTSTVVAFTVTGTQNILEFSAKRAPDLLKTFASSCAYVGMQNMQLGGGPVIIFCPEHAAILAGEGFTKMDVKRILYETARTRVQDFPEETLKYMVRHRRPRWFSSEHPEAGIPLADSPEDIQILVAGGVGPHSMFLPRSGLGVDARGVMRPIVSRHGTAASGAGQ